MDRDGPVFKVKVSKTKAGKFTYPQPRQSSQGNNLIKMRSGLLAILYEPLQLFVCVLLTFFLLAGGFRWPDDREGEQRLILVKAPKFEHILEHNYLVLDSVNAETFRHLGVNIFLQGGILHIININVPEDRLQMSLPIQRVSR